MTVTAKRRFGQHFLRDSGTLDRIIRTVQPASRDVMLEIGAGDGALTRLLLPRVHRLLAVEIDRECLVELDRLFAGVAHASLHPGDVLQMDLGALLNSEALPGLQIRVVGNFPYNIATAILERLLQLPLEIRDIVCMVQLEVAERIVAAPGSREYGYLSVWVRHRADAELKLAVNPACFVPRPKVWSALLSLTPRSSWKPVREEHEFMDLVKAAFAHRRKTLFNSLGYHARFGPMAGAMLEAAGIQRCVRPEQVPVEGYERLAAEYGRLEVAAV